MMLLVDAGNTRIKWALVECNTWLAEGVLDHEDAERLAQRIAMAGQKPERAVCVSVAGDKVTATIDATLEGIGVQAEWLSSSSECCGVRNSYDNPSQLGADRWAALVGARARHRFACLVVCAGTATTVDVLDADGCFLGGLILPGEYLMRRALAGNTAQLPFAEGRFEAQPRNTLDAIVSGCRQAQLGAIERIFRMIETEPGALCLLAGGASATLAPLLSVPVHRVDNLVLQGLAVIARASPRLPTYSQR